MFDSLQDRNFMIVAVAEESRGAEHARPWIEQAKPDYWCLIDPDHRVAALYGMVNVPQSVWIDEAGRIVRGPETAGSTDHFRLMDRTTRTLAPEHQTARARRTHGVSRRVGETGCGPAAMRWTPPAARAALPRITPDIALAHAHFRLGVWLRAHGKAAEADSHLAEASRLHPDSWNMWRQAADLDEVGKASGDAFWARVKALGDRAYYPPPDLPGFAPQG